jgi:hypothetical protein
MVPVKRVVRVAGAVAAASAFLVMAPSANAACHSSTPSSAAFSDPFDGDAGLAPEILEVRAAVDGDCNYSVDPGVPGPLIDDEAVFVYVDTDGDSATGSALFNGADVAVGTVGGFGADSPPLRGVWTGSSFSFSGGKVLDPGVGDGAFSATIDDLEIDPGTTTHVTVSTIYSGIYDSYIDSAPEPGAGGIALPVAFATSAPATEPKPQPSPEPAVAPTPSVPTPDTTIPVNGTRTIASDVGSCVVPATKGLSAAKASRRVARAKCAVVQTSRAYSPTVKAGQVIRSIPAAGAKTSRPVRLVISRGTRPARRLAGVTDAVAQLNAYAVLAARQAAQQG